ncbi:hypothetical protein [Oricola thermophila]|uniref:Uncharacterized protein n=1 Tax=Oricola thermophila TaxID=2742145 RepID=A0A6N1VFS5_9HYPH|nr:hypothetical protein [Oricola thermophila]QKV17817.1 hypothetical protein HTY61_04770 [Oricola thermophila]
MTEHKLADAYEDMTEIARLRAQLAQAVEALEKIAIGDRWVTKSARIARAALTAIKGGDNG